MNISELSLDAKYELFKKLSGTELVKLCSTSKTFRETCSNPRYNSIWKQKIMEDFSEKYDGPSANFEYMMLSHLYNKTFWLLRGEDDDAYYSKHILCNNRDQAVNYFLGQVKEDAENNPHYVFDLQTLIFNRENLEDDDIISLDGKKWLLEEIHLEKEGLYYIDLYDKYYNELKEILRKKNPENYEDVDIVYDALGRGDDTEIQESLEDFDLESVKEVYAWIAKVNEELQY